MPWRRLSLVLTLGSFAAFAACSRKAAEETAQARADLDQVCRAQRSYLETRRLMRSVSDVELSRERQARFQKDVKTALIRTALAEALRAPAGKRRSRIDQAVAKAGIAGWKCSELDQL